MSLAGARLGPYELLSAIGAGGMGEVYKARDSRLGRTVAVKILPPALAAEPERRSRFEREVRAIAALSHPHICAIFDVGRAAPSLPGGVAAQPIDYFVMELLEGETLADRLERQERLPLDAALRIATELCEALDKAHHAGIVHRDVKPGNVMLTKSGAKLLDFGVAKQHSAGPIPVGADQTETAGTAGTATAAGSIVGSVHYMAPEQVEGGTVDGRTDVWSLGALLYEMVTGMRPFTGESAARVMSAILTEQPPSLSVRQPVAPALLEHVVTLALAKNPDDRWQSIADMGHALRWLVLRPDSSTPSVPETAPPKRAPRRSALAGWMIALASLGFAGWSWTRPVAERSTETIRFDIFPPQGAEFAMFGETPAAWPVISPDGTRMVFAAAAQGAPPVLYVRRLESTETTALAGTEDAAFPFWSPDSRRIGFFARDKLRTIAIDGSGLRNVADVGLGQGRGGAWSPAGTILYAPLQVSGLMQVSAEGGTPRVLTQLDAATGETSHRWPTFLPDGNHFLYSVRGAETVQGIYVGSVADDSRKRVASDLSNAVFDREGYLIYTHGSALVAQPFDPGRLEVTGSAVPIVERIAYSPSYYNGAFSVSATGRLAYGLGALRTQLELLDRRGGVLQRVGATGEYMHPRLSPDGGRIAVAQLDPQISTQDLWLIDASRGDTTTRLTFSSQSERFPTWAPDGRRLAFSAQGGRGLSDVFVASSVDVSDARMIVGGPPRDEAERGGRLTNFATDWTADGSTLVFLAQRAKTNFDIDLLDLATGQARVFLSTPFVEVDAQVSKDMRWLAYASDESGRQEVYVRPFPQGSGKWQVSGSGGRQPRWRADGRELFYMAPDGTVMAVPLTASATFSPSVPVPLFATQVPERSPQFGRDYDVTGDGQRFLVNQATGTQSHATVVLNWTAERAALSTSTR